VDILQAIRGRNSLHIQLAVGGVQSWASKSHLDSFPTYFSSVQFAHCHNCIIGILKSDEPVGHALIGFFVVNNVNLEYDTIGSE
jgi:hypothetical protein